MNARLVPLLALVTLLNAACEAPAPVDAELQRRIAAVEEAVRADTCFRDHPDGTGCDWGDFPYRPEEFSMARGSGEAILVIDSFAGALPTYAIRYKNRLKAALTVTAEGGLAPVDFAWHVPVVLHAALAEFADPVHLPAEKLRPLSTLLWERYGKSDPLPPALHGPTVLGLVLENSPEQPVIVMEHPDFPEFARDAFCATDISAEALAVLRARAQSVAQALRHVIAAENIRFVNLSGGVTLESVQTWWTRTCTDPLPEPGVLRLKLAQYAPIYEVLFATPGVFTAHSSYPAGSREDYPYDYPSDAFPNRLRFGFFNVLESKLDPEGHGDTSVLDGWPARENVDVYLNTGVLQSRPFPHNSTPLLEIGSFGTDLLPITRSATSWIAPLGLARFIHLRHTVGASQAMDDALIATLSQRLVPSTCGDGAEPCLFQDPLLHGQVEAVRLGYRPREYVAAEP